MAVKPPAGASYGGGTGPGQTKPLFDRSIYGRPMGDPLTREEQQAALDRLRTPRPMLVLQAPQRAPSAPAHPLYLVAPKDLRSLVEQNRRRFAAGKVTVDPIALPLQRPVLTLGDSDNARPHR
jgi:hypothetical protein